jgi:hypothetical protein
VYDVQIIFIQLLLSMFITVVFSILLLLLINFLIFGGKKEEQNINERDISHPANLMGINDFWYDERYPLIGTLENDDADDFGEVF